MSVKLALQTAQNAVLDIRISYTEYVAEGRCSNWDEYIRSAGAISALDRVSMALEDLIADRDSID